MTEERHRREFLRAATATVAVAGIAGCVGGDGEETSTDQMDEESMTDDGTSGTDSMSEDSMTDDSMEGESMETESMDDESMDDDSMSDDSMGETHTFTVTVTNVSEEGTISAGGEDLAVPLSPGAYAVHSPDVAPFESGTEASAGLESLAEDGMPGDFADELAMMDGVHAGAFDTPDMADEARPIHPDESFSFEVEAGEGDRLTVATMFAQSNDVFVAPEPSGIALFDGGDPVDGDVSGEFALWDAGTEANEEPGAGSHQAPRQDGTDSGEDEMASIRRVDEVEDMYSYPDADEVIEVTVSAM